MQKSVLVLAAAALAACGAAVTSSNDAAQSATQKNRPNAPPPGGVGFQNFDEGGMAGCFDPNLTGYPRAAAERAGGVPCQGGKSGVSTSSSDPWLGTYMARVEGGTATMSIANGGAPSRYRVGFEVTTPSGCSGEVDGVAVASGNRLSLIVPVPDSGSQCRIDINRNGARVAAQESDCFYFHGAQCEFSGSYARQGGAAAPSRVSAAASARAPSIVGAWVLRGEQCGGEGLVIQTNGVYLSGEESGRWSLAGNTLTFTALQRAIPGGGLGEDEPVRNPRPERHQILAQSARAFSMRAPGGRVWNMVRCR